MAKSAKNAKKLKWTDTEDIAFKLIDLYPTMDPMRLRLADLQKKIVALPDFGDDPKKSSDSILESIQTTWFDERADMEDELGPLVAVTDDEDTLDEDDYRDDEPSVKDIVPLDDEDDEDEDEFGDGFQEEGLGDDDR